MSILNKKLMGSFAALGAVTLTASSVVACGFSLERIINRSTNVSEYHGTFSFPVSNWNTAHTMMAADQEILAQVSATIIGLDEFNRTHGELVYSNTDPNSNIVGTISNNGLTYTYTLRSGLHWVNQQGESVDPIRASDMKNTALYTLNSAVTGSTVSSVWTQFIAGASEFQQFLTSQRHSYVSFDEAYRAFQESELYTPFGLTTNDETGEISFTLTQIAPHFESALAYLPFAPIHRNMLEETGLDFRDIYFSGAFIPVQVSANLIRLEKNEYFHFSDKVSLTAKNYHNVGAGGAARERVLFESGDLSSFIVDPVDTLGWNRYVGNDPSNPSFTRMYNAPSTHATSSFIFFLNTFNSALNTGSQQALNASRLLQYRNARAFINTAMDRSEYIRHFSQQFDGGSSTSRMIRNTYVPEAIGVYNGKDYTEFVENAVRDLVSDTWTTDAPIDISDGTDFMLGNSEYIMGKTQEELIDSIWEFMEENNLGSEQITLQWLLNPDQETTLNPFFIRMFAQFNNIENNPINIVPLIPSTVQQFRDLGNRGEFDLYAAGWGADFADPITFLNTMVLGGDFNAFTGTARFINEAGELSNPILETTATQDYIDAVMSFTELIDAGRAIGDNLETRFTKFAEAEAQILFQDFLFSPLMTRMPIYNWTVSYVVPHTWSYLSSWGSSYYKRWMIQISERLLTAEEIAEVLEEFDRMMEMIQYDLSYRKDEDIRHSSSSQIRNFN